MDTTIGVVVASIVNRIHLPRRKNIDTLFILNLENCKSGSDSKLSTYSLAELNRMMDDGAKFTISNDQSQATVRELFPGVQLRYPIITMDGAALYDVNSLEYICTIPMTEAQAERIMCWLRENKIPFFSNTIKQNLLVIRYASLENKGMQLFFENKRKSPYRNFIKTEADSFKHIVSILVMDTHERIEATYEQLVQQTWV